MTALETELLVYGTAFAVGAPICYLCWRVARGRQRALRAVARGLGLEFWPRWRLDMPPIIPSRFRSLSWGSTRDFVFGEHGGRQVVVFDYFYQGSASAVNPELHVRVFTVVTTRWYQPFSDALEPEGKLLIRPETAADRAVAAAGLEDIDFESQEFSDRFFVASPDRKFAYAVIHPRMMEYLLARPGWCIEMSGPDLLIMDSRRWSVAEYASEFKRAFGILSGFLDLIPGHVLSGLREKGRTG